MTKKEEIRMPSTTWGGEIEKLLKEREGTYYQGSAAWQYIDAIEANLTSAKRMVWCLEHGYATPHIHNIAVLCLAMLFQAREEDEGA